MKMTRNEIIQGLQFTIEMFLLNTNTGEKYEEPRNDMDKTTIDACRSAIDLLEQEPCEDAISREDLIQKFYDDVFIRDKTDSKEDYQQVFASTVLEVIKYLPPVTPTQETVLDKIRAEVEQLPITDTAVRLVTDIIDKYKADKE